MSGVEQRDLGRSYGVLGVGAIGEAIVTGLCDGVDDAPQIVVSPRNRERAGSLAGRFASVVVGGDNQEVVDAGGVVLICVRPHDAATVLKPLAFPADTPVVSMMAGLSVAQVQELIGPVRSLSRAIPLPAVRDRAGVTPVCPATGEARCLFDALGRSVAVADEAVFDAFSAATATIAAHFQYLETIAAWLSAQGVAAEDAAHYVSSVFAGIATELAGAPTDLSALADSHATLGGINEQFRTILADAGSFALVDRALAAILDRLRGTQLDA